MHIWVYAAPPLPPIGAVYAERHRGEIWLFWVVAHEDDGSVRWERYQRVKDTPLSAEFVRNILKQFGTRLARPGII